MTRRWLLALAMALAGPTALAQDVGNPFQSNREIRGQAGEPEASSDATDAAATEEPVLRTDLPEAEAIPGQSLRLRLTVLVPTFMPDPPAWPGFETPNLMVRLPERATSPTSERIGGETWSGITRVYRLVPMIAGEFALPPQEVRVTWRNPATDAVETVGLWTDPVTFKGVLPDGAEGLDPFVGAAALDLVEEIEGTPDDMVPGDSLTRTVTARVEGVSPMFLPPLLPPTEIPGLAAYPDAPVVVESDDRGAVSGTRIERVTYVAEGGARGSLPPVVLDWFDIATGEVQTAELAGVAVSVEGPPAVPAEPLDWRVVAVAATAVLLATAGLALALRRVIPVLRRHAERRRQAYRASETFAWQSLMHAARARDEAALRPALDLWARRRDGPDPRHDPRVEAALVAIGAARYAREPGPPRTGSVDPWIALARALRAARARSRSDRTAGALPPLNPAPAV
jgi:hypothetical protein